MYSFVPSKLKKQISKEQRKNFLMGMLFGTVITVALRGFMKTKKGKDLKDTISERVKEKADEMQK